MFALALPLVGGTARPGYSHYAQYISELGESGARGAAWVNFAGFLPIGVLTLGFVTLAGVCLPAAVRTRLGLALFAGVGLGYLVPAFFPCDPGCPASGSTSQSVHGAFGLLEYLGGGLGLLLLRGAWRDHSPLLAMSGLSAICGVVVLAAFVGLFVPALAPARGLVQRAAETALFLWLLAASANLYATGRRRSPA